jgi:hypothetical protein
MDIHAHASVFNVETATCRWICPDCDSVIYVTEAPTSGAATPGGNLAYTLTATMKTGGTFNATQSASWSSTATNIATVTATGTQAGLAQGVSAGSSSIKASYRDTGVPSWQPGSASCQPTTQCPVFIGNPTALINVKLPKYIDVYVDSTQVFACPIGSSRQRNVKYNVLASDGSQVTTVISILETVDPSTQSSCTNSTVGTSYQCTPIANGIFTDGLNPGCPATAALNNGCGYTHPLQKWEWCNPLTVPSDPNLGTIGTDTVHNNSINLGGNSTSFAPGTTFPHD